MRQYENILDQQNAKKAAALLNKMHQNTVTKGKDSNEDKIATSGLVSKRKPELTPENRSNNISNCNDSVATEKQGAQQNDIAAGNTTPIDLTIKGQYLNASADQLYPQGNLKNCDAQMHVSAFSSELPTARQQMTVEKPSNGPKNNESLQKSATTNANTIHVSLMSQFTPKVKATGSCDNDQYSEKLTPDNATTTRSQQQQHHKETLSQRRNGKINSKEQTKIRQSLQILPSESNVASSNNGPQADALQTTRQTRQQRASLQKLENSQSEESYKKQTATTAIASGEISQLDNAAQKAEVNRSLRPKRLAQRNKASTALTAAVTFQEE